MIEEIDRTRPYCPTCEPETDPVEELVTVRYCGRHDPDRAGVEDECVPPGLGIGGGEADGHDCRIVAGFIR